MITGQIETAVGTVGDTESRGKLRSVIHQHSDTAMTPHPTQGHRGAASTLDNRYSHENLTISVISRE